MSEKRSSEENSNSSEVKKQKTSNDVDEHGHHDVWQSMGAFQLVNVLNDNAQAKSLIIHAKVNGASNKDKESHEAASDDAVVLLEKTPFETEDAALRALLSSSTRLKQVFNNDIYGRYECVPEDNALRATIIYPATKKHIDKYTAQGEDMIYETAKDYETITRPWIESSSFEMQWIYNILEKKKEAEYIIYEDADPINGFILIPDLKWDQKTLDNMYVSAIVHRHGIKSLRDLTAEHLPLLKNMLDAGLVAIEKKYGIKQSKVRAYFHYQPSYYHLHVHFNQTKYKAPGTDVPKAHLLTDVIDNIEMCSDYYQRKTLAFVARESMPLYQHYKEAGKV